MSPRPDHVVITGSAQGLGLSMAKAFLRAGYRVMLCDIDGDAVTREAAALSATNSGTVACRQVDVTDDESVAQLARGVAAWTGGGLDVLVNNAGVIARGHTQDLATDSWARVMDVNLGGAFRCARVLHPLLTDSPHPTVINLGSVGSTLGMPRRAAYTAAKTGILGLTRTLAAEWGPVGVRVNAIAPGFIDTSMMRSGFAQGLLDEGRLHERIPLRRLGQADEIASVAVFLASRAASYINGACIPVDGGVTVDGTFF